MGQLTQRPLFWVVAGALGLAAVLGVAAIVLVATYSGGGPSAEEVLDRSAEKSQELQSAHIEFQLDTDFGGFSYSYRGTGDVELPDKVYVIFDFGGEFLETLILGSDYYVKPPFGADWIPVSPQELDFDPAFLSDVFDVSQQVDITRFAEDVSKQDEILSGQSVYHIIYSVAPNNILGLLESLGLPLDPSVELDGDVVVDVWIDKALFFPRRSRTEMNLEISDAAVGQTIRAQVTVQYDISRFNEPIEFPQP